MNGNTPSRRTGIAIAAGTSVALSMFACNVSQTQQLPPATGSGGITGSGQGGAAVIVSDEGGANGSSATGDAAVVAVKLDVQPAWWGTADVPVGPEIGATPTADANCGNMTNKTERRPADVMLVLDRSASMEWVIPQDCNCPTTTTTGGPGRNPGGGIGGGVIGGRGCAGVTDCTTRWQALTPALTTAVSSSSYVNWGLKMFPTPGNSSSCYESTTIDVPVAATSASSIQSMITSATFDLGTPTTVALKAATDYLKTLTDGNDKFILLATDGQPNCAGNPPDINTDDVDGAAAACQAAHDAGIKVFVVGIGPNLSNLTKLAQAGGTTDYFPVSSPQELVDALSSIGKLVGSCSFKSDQAPPDPDNVAVYLGGQRVDKDPANGWTFGSDTQEIQLNGSTCAEMSKGDQVDVQILFGCPGQTYFPSNIY